MLVHQVFSEVCGGAPRPQHASTTSKKISWDLLRLQHVLHLHFLFLHRKILNSPRKNCSGESPRFPIGFRGFSSFAAPCGSKISRIPQFFFDSLASFSGSRGSSFRSNASVLLQVLPKRCDLAHGTTVTFGLVWNWRGWFPQNPTDSHHVPNIHVAIWGIPMDTLFSDTPMWWKSPCFPILQFP